MLVDATEKQIILGLFQESIEQFEAFHLKEDDCEFLKKVILELIKKSRLSHRRIAELVGVNRGVVHRIARKA